MFFIFGITKKSDNLDLSETKLCSVCDSYGRYEAFVEYNALSLFFIPVFKWGRKYFIRANCCGSIFSISDDLGRNIENGRNVTITDDDLIPVYTNQSRVFNCIHCGYEVQMDHTFCPNCGKRL